jgi:hypothetical protein
LRLVVGGRGGGVALRHRDLTVAEELERADHRHCGRILTGCALPSKQARAEGQSLRRDCDVNGFFIVGCQNEKAGQRWCRPAYSRGASSMQKLILLVKMVVKIGVKIKIVIIIRR